MGDNSGSGPAQVVWPGAHQPNNTPATDNAARPRMIMNPFGGLKWRLKTLATICQKA
jgi:hypothetical protein